MENCSRNCEKWKNFAKVYKVEKFVNICESSENLAKTEKLLERRRLENSKIVPKILYFVGSGKLVKVKNM